MGILEDFRNKPDHIKQNVAFGAALGITLMVGLVWVSTLPARLNGEVQLSTLKEEVVEERVEAPKKEKASFSEMFGSVRAQFGAVAEGIRKLKDIEFSSGTDANEEAGFDTGTDEVAENNSESVEMMATTSTQKKQVILIGTTTKENKPSPTIPE